MAGCVCAAGERPAKTSPAPKVRVGTFDSRAIAMAHFGKMIKDGWLRRLYAEHEKAKAAGNEKLVKQLETKGQDAQRQLHMQMFGTAPVDEAWEEIRKDMSNVARSAGVDVILSVHDVVYKSTSAEFVDITEAIP